MTETMRIPEVAPLRSGLLDAIPGVRHALTGRVAGMGRADGNVGFSAPRDRDDAWAMRQRWCAAAGLEARRLVTLGQIHGAEVLVAEARHAGWGAMPGTPQIGLADALATDAEGPVLVTLHADCQPILMVDPGTRRRGPVVAAIHAGWRGTVANIVGRAVAVMHAVYGSDAADIHVFLGPAIGACCYEVGDEVAAAWRDRGGADAAGALRPSGDRVHLSLTEANAISAGADRDPA